MDDKTKISEIIKYLDKNGFYKLEKDKNARDIYTKVINYFMTKTTVSYKSNILQIKNIVGGNNEFIADLKYLNPKKKGVKKTCLDLRDKKILALLKDYEYMLKGSLKYLEDVYLKLYEMGISNVDYSKPLEEVNLEELVNFIKEGGVEKKNKELDEFEKYKEEYIEEYEERFKEKYVEDNWDEEEDKEKQNNNEDDEEYIEDIVESKDTDFNDDEYIEDYQLVEDEDEEEIEKVDDLGVSEEVYIEDGFKSNQNLEEVDINTPDNSEKLLDTNEEKEDIKKEEDSKPKKFKLSERESTPILSTVEKETSKSNERLKIGQKQKKINFANLLIYSRFD